MNEATKILILSDSHGRYEFINLAILKESPDMILHLGDGIFDLARIRSDVSVPAIGVKGNCDFGTEEQAIRVMDIEGVKIYMTHGHIYDVKHGYATAIDAAKEVSADILLFGHTHKAIYEMSGRMHVMNPGSIREGCYATIEIKNGTPMCRLKNMKF